MHLNSNIEVTGKIPELVPLKKHFCSKHKLLEQSTLNVTFVTLPLCCFAINHKSH